uniref:Uncharacterized protein n=1 Tax=Trypanosoma congolense (strain IL3000) TaxID=1068625 RepID=G0UJ34_TRYCI|nr:conserved hypothetical protein [Trypanosoma congolense IL3000]
MHVVSDLQRRPKTARLASERAVMQFYSLCSLIQLVCLIVHVTQFDMASSRTFRYSVWTSNPLELTPQLRWITSKCTLQVTSQDVFAFSNVSLTISEANVHEMFASFASTMHAAFLLSALALIFGVLNRQAVAANFYEFRWRNFVLRKGVISALELVFIIALIYILAMSKAPHRLLYEYLEFCKAKTKGSLPYCTTAPIVLFITSSLATYFIGTIVYLRNAAPRYGVMSEEEVGEYMEWLRNREERRLEVKRMMEEMKQASVRLKLVLDSEKLAESKSRLAEKGS